MEYDFRKDPILAPAYDYWRSKRGTRAMPSRRDIEPTEIPKLLRNIQITDIVDGGKRLRYRLVGTAIVEAFGAELTGRYFDEVFSGAKLRFVAEHYLMVCRERLPLVGYNHYISKRYAPYVSYRLIMPLSENGTDVSQCFTAINFELICDALETVGNLDFFSAHGELIRDDVAVPIPA